MNGNERKGKDGIRYLRLFELGVNDVNDCAKVGGRSVFTLSIFLCCILFLRRWAARPKSLQKNMVMVTAIIGRAISQNRISDRPWTDHMKSKFIP